MEPSAAKQTNRAPALVLLLLVVLATAALAVVVLHRLDVRPRTSDAIVTANTIQVVPEVAGKIVRLPVKDDAVVRKGDVLFVIDQERYALALAEAKAQVRALEAQIDLTDRTVSSQVTGVSVARANAEAARARLKQATDTLVRLIAPMMPHLAEEAWAKRGHDGLVADAMWPDVDAALLVEDSVTLGVQVNGKKRGDVTVPRTAQNADIEAAVLALDTVKVALGGKPVRKVIVVPMRIVNVVG